MIFFYLAIIAFAIAFIFYLTPKRDKIGNWILNKIKTEKDDINNE